MTSLTSAGLTPARLERGLDGDLAEFVRGHARQRAVERADGRAGGAGDDDGGFGRAHDDLLGLGGMAEAAPFQSNDIGIA